MSIWHSFTHLVPVCNDGTAAILIKDRPSGKMGGIVEKRAACDYGIAACCICYSAAKDTVSRAVLSENGILYDGRAPSVMYPRACSIIIPIFIERAVFNRRAAAAVGHCTDHAPQRPRLFLDAGPVEP